MYVCVLHSHSAQGNQKMVSDTQELGLQTLVSHPTWVLWKSSHVLSITKPSLQPHHKPLRFTLQLISKVISSRSVPKSISRSCSHSGTSLCCPSA